MSEQSRQQPYWQAASRLDESDALTRQWLFDQQSLTRRLSALSDQAFSVIPLKQAQERLREDECTALHLPPQSLGWVREVYLCGHDEPWVFARSVASLKTFNRPELDLGGLGARSLGERLFSDPAFTRGPLEACHYPKHWLPTAVQQPNLWARRSCFSQGSAHILVTEVFLPAFWQRLERAH